MKTARVIFCSFFSLVVATNVMAQSRTSATAGERYVAPIGLPRPVPKQVSIPLGVSFKVTGLDSAGQDLSDGSTHAFLDTAWNLTNQPQTIYFRRYEAIADGWSSYVCWGVTCNPASVDSTSYTIPPGGYSVLSLDVSAGVNDISDTGVIWIRLGVVGASSDTVLLVYYGSYTAPDPPLVFKWSSPTIFEQSYQNSAADTLSNMLENHAARGIDYTLTYQDSLPAGWAITGFLDRKQPYNPQNYQDTFTTSNTLVTNFSAYPDSTYQQQLSFALSVPTVTKVDSAVIYLNVHPQTSNPADSATYRFVMVVAPPAGVAGTQENSAGLAVTNAWPNPLIGGGMLHLEIQTDAGGDARAIIYDLTGSEKGTLDLGALHAGTNEVQASAPNLPSGDYIIRVTQAGSTSEVVRINYVK